MKREKMRGQKAELRRVTVSSLVCMGIGFLFLILTIGANVKVTDSLEKENEVTLNTNQYRMASKELTYNVQAFAVTGEEDHYDAYMKEVNEDKNREKAVAELEELGLIEEEWDMIDRIAELSNGLVPLETQAFEAGKKGDLETARAMVFGTEYEDTIDEINKTSDEMINAIGVRMKAVSSRLEIQTVVFEVLVVCSFLMVMWQILKTVKFARKKLLNPILVVEEQMGEIAEGNLHADFQIKPDETEVGRMVSSILKMKGSMEGMIGEISGILNEMAQGNFRVDVQKEYVGEFVVIKESMQKIIKDMNVTLGSVNVMADQINQGAEQLANASQDIAMSSTSQASAVEEVAASMAEVVENMRRNAEESNQCVQLSTNAAQSLMTGNRKLEQLESAISNINQCSEKIGTIIETINDIANQTNLLALNAAIEAARAGEAGKGFAVVAEEVKNLAGESSDAVEKTTQLIQETVNAVNIGINLAEDTKVSMDEVMQGAKTATEKMSEISEKLNNDVGSMEQVNIAINQIAEVVESNTAASEETAAVSQQQKEQGESMAQLVGTFQIKL